MFVDATHERLARDVLGWMSAHRLFGDPRDCERTYLEQALVAATFGYLCSAAEVGESEYLRAAQFTAIFLYFDDTPNVDAHPAVVEWLGELERIGAGGSALEDFHASFADYRASLEEERRLDCSTLAREDYLQLRRRTIFVEPFLDHWRVLAGIDIEAPAREILRTGQGLARDLIILANDLGSLVRDTTAEHGEMNVVVRDAQLRGSSIEVAIERAIAQHNALVGQLRELVSLAEDSRERPLPTLARLLTRVVDGNIATMKLLTRRYTQSTALLDRLLAVAR
jgi:hypothetical protein